MIAHNLWCPYSMTFLMYVLYSNNVLEETLHNRFLGNCYKSMIWNNYIQNRNKCRLRICLFVSYITFVCGNSHAVQRRHVFKVFLIIIGVIIIGWLVWTQYTWSLLLPFTHGRYDKVYWKYKKRLTFFQILNRMF